MATPTLTLSPNLGLLQDLDMGIDEDFFSIDGSDLVLEEGNIDTFSPLATEVDQAQVRRKIETHCQLLTCMTDRQIYECAIRKIGSR